MYFCCTAKLSKKSFGAGFTLTYQYNTHLPNSFTAYSNKVITATVMRTLPTGKKNNIKKKQGKCWWLHHSTFHSAPLPCSQSHTLREVSCFLGVELFVKDLLLLFFAIVNSCIIYTSITFINKCIFSIYNIHTYLPTITYLVLTTKSGCVKTYLTYLSGRFFEKWKLSF